jgi:hypothetical protein
MQSDVVVQLLGSVVLAAIAGAIINGIINRRKLGAEATEIITKAASGVVERLEAELTRISGDNSRLRDRILTLEAAEDADRAVLQLHASWDHLAVERLLEAGIEMPMPPPLSPPPLSRLSSRIDEE